LRRIAAFAVQHPNDIALGTVSALAQRIGVQPSAIVRFANRLGYDGFTDMQQIFRARLTGPTTLGYRERIASSQRAGNGEGDGVRPAREPADILAAFVADDIGALEALYRSIPLDRLNRAIALLAAADAIYLLAQGRSFPVAFYLDYGLTRLDLRSHLIDSVGGLTPHRIRALTPRDVVVAVSFRNYSRDVIEIAAEVAARRTPLIAITDNPLGPIGKLATVSFEIPELQDRPFRSLVAPICLAESLVVALGHHLTAPRRATGARRRSRS
jgi:DNA-binding MurR/RpiR family transcriptional regulator